MAVRTFPFLHLPERPWETRGARQLLHLEMRHLPKKWIVERVRGARTNGIR